MATRFNFDPQALDDLFEHHDLIAARSPERAGRWQAGLLAAIESLKSLPNRCPVAPESRSATVPVRELFYSPGKKRQGVYRILFRADGGVINILAIRHSTQDFRPL